MWEQPLFSLLYLQDASKDASFHIYGMTAFQLEFQNLGLSL